MSVAVETVRWHTLYVDTVRVPLHFATAGEEILEGAE